MRGTRRGIVVATVAVLSGAGTVVRWATAAAPPHVQPLEVDSHARLVVVAPHPDDETIGAGGLIQRVLARGGSVRVVLVTAGDGYVEAVARETGLPRPRPAEFVHYGQRRLHEARAALRTLGEQQARLEFLGFPDGGLKGLLHAHWYRTAPECSLTTGASDPPYDDALEPDVPYDGDDLRRELVRILQEATPTMVALPDPLDKHPDHHAAALFTLLAVDDWAGKEAQPRAAMPRLLAYLVHWPGWPPGWDASTPTPHAGDATLEMPPSLPARRLMRTALALTDAEVRTKEAAIAQYVTQVEAMRPLLAAFVRHSEPFTLLTPADAQQVGRMIEHHGPQTKTRHRR